MSYDSVREAGDEGHRSPIGGNTSKLAVRIGMDGLRRYSGRIVACTKTEYVAGPFYNAPIKA